MFVNNVVQSIIAVGAWEALKHLMVMLEKVGRK